MKCAHCGAELPEGSAFCTSCGSKVEPSAQVAAQAPSSPQMPSDAYQTPEATPVPSAWQAPASTAQAPDATAAQPPENAPLTETRVSPAVEDTATSREEGERRDDEEYRRAKEAYKEARKNAGKSYMPAIAAGVVVAILLSATSAGAAGYYVKQATEPDAAKVQELTDQLNDANEQIESLKSQLADAKKAASSASSTSSSATGSTSTESSASTGSDSSSSAGAASSVDLSRPETFVGTWQGKLTATEWTSGTNCYGGDKNPAVIKITNVNSSTGQVTLDASLTYHGHTNEGASGSSATIDGDDYETYTGITGTLKNDTLTFDVPLTQSSGDTKSLKVEAKFARSGGEVKMTLDTRSGFQRSGYLSSFLVHDTFELTYQGNN